jgi:chromate reductase
MYNIVCSLAITLLSVTEETNRESHCADKKNQDCPEAYAGTVVICSEPPVHLFAFWSLCANIQKHCTNKQGENSNGNNCRNHDTRQLNFRFKSKINLTSVRQEILNLHSKCARLLTFPDLRCNGPSKNENRFKPSVAYALIMSKPFHILGFAGSLRKDSYNRALLRVASELMPKNAVLEVFDLEGIPPFNQDLEAQPPGKVKDFKDKIKAADALLIATPEYNYSVPGVLKNAIDWASRPYSENAFNDKPVAMMGASTGMLGTARAQYHLRQCFVFLNMHTVNKPEVMVNYAQEKFDADGRLNDEKARKRVAELIESLIALTARMAKQ